MEGAGGSLWEGEGQQEEEEVEEEERGAGEVEFQTLHLIQARGRQWVVSLTKVTGAW